MGTQRESGFSGCCRSPSLEKKRKNNKQRRAVSSFQNGKRASRAIFEDDNSPESGLNMQVAEYIIPVGGGRNNKPANVRSANRNRNAPWKRNANLGFRVVVAPLSTGFPNGERGHCPGHDPVPLFLICWTKRAVNPCGW